MFLKQQVNPPRFFKKSHESHKSHELKANAYCTASFVKKLKISIISLARLLYTPYICRTIQRT